MAGPIGVGVSLNKEILGSDVKRESAVEEAQRLVHGDRGQAYGHPLEDFTADAAAMNAYLMKVMREAERPKRDNRVDIAGYAETLQMVHDRMDMITPKNVP